ncbi:MAG: hypothetical protein ABR501_03525 [Pyrinomonadaceae bacterium]
MAQLWTLMWLKWTLFRNSLRSSKAVVNRIASVLAMLAALALGTLTAVGLGVAAYALTSPDLGFQNFRSATAERASGIPSAEFMFFSIFALCYMLWALLPLSIGSSRQFDPGNLLLYPISLRKLFAIDFVSEISSLQSVFAIPAIFAIGIGAGLAQGNVLGGLLLAGVAAIFGIALSKWVATSLGALIRRKQTRGETLLALLGVVVGLGGALLGQIAPLLLRHSESISALRWTPPGAVAVALTQGLRGDHRAVYAIALALVSVYALILIVVTYGLAHRAVLGSRKIRRTRQPTLSNLESEDYTGWEIPFVSPALSAILEKELRYVMRNAQVRMMTVMPLILIVVRLMNRRRFDPHGAAGGSGFAADFFTYGQGLVATSGVLYVFLILAGIFCNQFAFEHAGIRTLILSPIDRKIILVGKNVAVIIVALIFSAGLLLVNELVFRDLTLGSLLFATLSFFTFAPLMSLMGNWMSVSFPKRMKFGKRLNVSGVVGLLLIPMIIVLALSPLAAAAVGYVAQNLFVEYVTLAILAVLASGLYLLVIGAQGEFLQRRELELLEVVNEQNSD